MIKYILGKNMKSKFKEHLKIYYNETNKKLPEEGRKYNVGKKERFPSIVFGYILILVSFIPFFYIKIITKDALILFGCSFLMGLFILKLSNFSLIKLLIMYQYYKNIDLYFNDIMYEMFLKGKESKKLFFKSLLQNDYTCFIITILKKSIIFSRKEKVKIIITNKQIKVYKNRKQFLLIKGIH